MNKMKSVGPLFGLLVLSCLSLVSATSKLQERYNWKQIDFLFPSENIKQQALLSGNYIPRNGLPVGIERWENKLFVSVPRWRDGIPATLTYIDMDKTPSGSPALIPYPDWKSNVAGDCANGLSTVYRIKADKCGRLWVLDTGTVGIGNTTKNVCPYSINIFDLKTNRKIRRYELRPEDTNPNTFIANIAVDIGKSCEDTMAYASDELGYGLIAYSFEQNKSWRFSHSFFFPDPLRGDFNVAGLNFQWGEEGIFGIALSPMQTDGYRTLFFSPLASHREFSVSTKVLRDSAGVEESYHKFNVLDERGPDAHTTSRVMSEEGLMLFNLIDQNSVGCWHSTLPYSPENHAIVDRDDVELVFPADVKIDETETVWVISDRMPVFLITDLDYNDINFRIFSAPLKELVKGTVCDVAPLSSRFGQIIDEYTEKAPLVKIPSTYPQTTLKYTSYETPASHLYSTQQFPTPPKAYAFNSHNGVQFESHSPHSGNFNHRHYHHQHQHPNAGDNKPSWYTHNFY